MSWIFTPPPWSTVPRLSPDSSGLRRAVNWWFTRIFLPRGCNNYRYITNIFRSSGWIGTKICGRSFFFVSSYYVCFSGETNFATNETRFPQPPNHRNRGPQADFSGWRQPASGRSQRPDRSVRVFVEYIGEAIPYTAILGRKKNTIFFRDFYWNNPYIFMKRYAKYPIFPGFFDRSSSGHLSTVSTPIQGPGLSTLSSSPAQPQALQRPWAELRHRLRSLKLT